MNKVKPEVIHREDVNKLGVISMEITAEIDTPIIDVIKKETTICMGVTYERLVPISVPKSKYNIKYTI